jgi:hypothetical protein
MGAMVDFLKNRKNKLDFNKASNEEIEKLMRKCFRYAQDKLKEQFKDYLLTRKASETLKYNKMNLKNHGVNDIDMIEEEVVNEMDSDEREFVENISWDTESDPADIEFDDELIKSHCQDKDNRYSQDDMNSDMGINQNQDDDHEKEFGEFYNYNFHAFKKKYRTLNKGYTQFKFKQNR